MKAFIGINIIMGITKLPQVALYWSSDDFFGNQGIKKVMTNAVFSRERFTTVTAYRGFVTKSQLLETLFTRH